MPPLRPRLATALAVWLLAFAAPALAAPGTGTLYGTDARNGNLLVINPADGSHVIVGPTGVGSLPSVAADPRTGRIYAGGGAGSPILYELSALDGSATPIGDTGLGFASIGALEFSADGVLYASVNLAGNGNTGSDHLATLDLDTGDATVIGPFGSCTGVSVPADGSGSCTLEGIEALAFDDAGVLWASLSARGAAGAPGLYQVDPVSGAATFQRALDDGTGNPPSGGVVSLSFDCSGTLFGGTARALAGGSDGGDLVEIDPASGLFTTLGNVVADASLGGLSFNEGCTPLPGESATWGRVKALFR